MAAYDTSLGRRGILEEGGQQPSGPVPLSTSAGSPPRGPIPLSTSAGSPPRGAVGGSPPRATAGRPASRPASRPAARSEKLAEMGGGLGGETRIFARGQTIFWRLLQLATAIIALAVMTASSANGMYFQYYQLICMLTPMVARPPAPHHNTIPTASASPRPPSSSTSPPTSLLPPPPSGGHLNCPAMTGVTGQAFISIVTAMAAVGGWQGCAFIFMVAAMTAVAAWCLAHLLHSIGRLMTRKWRITLFALLDFVSALPAALPPRSIIKCTHDELEALMPRKWRISLFALLDFVSAGSPFPSPYTRGMDCSGWRLCCSELVAWIALAGASAAAGLTSFADKGSGMVQPGYCQMGLFSSFCARTKAATAMAFITFFVLIPSLIASATRAVVSWFED
ncbi:unnamed protein product [Closterium sp. NIES-65]|nr:unnamed protein product [Closterium sp. NIES-65]